MAIGWDERTVTWSRAEVFSPERLSGSATFALVRADPQDRLDSYDARHETTAHPCDYLWGPGSWQDAQAWLDAEQPGEDQVATLDRLFMLRCHGRILFLPQAVPVVAGLAEQGGTGPGT